MDKEFKVRDLRRKDQYKIDDAYLNGYARLCGAYATLVYNSLSRHADFHTQEAFPSIEKMAYQHDISKPSVIKGIKNLEEWGIIKTIKEKDPKTKRQLVNVYVLIDKVEWRPKPSSGVNEVYSETEKAESTTVTTRVNDSDESRVNDVYCKDDTGIKDTQFKVGDENVAGKINELLDLFKNVNPSFKRLFSNKTERASAARLIEQYGFDEMSTLVTGLEEICSKPYAPRITTPYELEKGMGKLKMFYEQKKVEKKNFGIIKT